MTRRDASDLPHGRTPGTAGVDPRGEPARHAPTRLHPRAGRLAARAPLLLAIMPAACLWAGCAGCVGTGGQMVPLTPDPPTPAAVKIYDSDIHLFNESEEDLRGLTVSVRSALGGADHARSVGVLKGKGHARLPSAETRWYLAEREVLTVAAEGHSPATFTVHLRPPGGR